MASDPAAAGSRFDVAAFIDARPIGWREIITLVICTVALFLDSFDVFFVGKLAPAIAHGFGVQPVAMKTVFVWQQAGMALGAFLLPPLADRIGRRPVLMLCGAVFGTLTIIAVFVPTLAWLAALRGASGIFLAAMLPIGLALISEVTPKRRRATFLAIALVGFSAGNAGASAVAAWLLVPFGWQVGFWLAGILPLATLPLLLLIPESLAFRVSRDPRDHRIPAAIRAIDPGAPIHGGEVYHLGDTPPPAKSGPLALLSNRYVVQTLILWLACFLSLGNIALLSSWMTTYFNQLSGIPVPDFARFDLIAFPGGVVGTLTIGWLMDRIHPYWLIAGYFLLDAVAIGALGFVSFGTAALARPGSTRWRHLVIHPKCARAGSAGRPAWAGLAGSHFPILAGSLSVQLCRSMQSCCWSRFLPW
jgi:AAHS family 4-hydroxybenzoate transporter-like MFS transporter